MKIKLAGMAAAAAVLFVASCSHIPLAPAPSRPVQARTAPLPVTPGHYIGAFASGSPRSYAGITSFASATHTPVNIALYYSAWHEPFRVSFAQAAWSHHATVLVQLDPTGESVRTIARGGSDAYLRRYADEVRSFGHPVVLSIGHEMNGSWYSWGYHRTPASEFIAAWRHIVTLFRAQGADNVTWLWTVNRTKTPITGPVHEWWPGAAYVTWVGIDGYYINRTDSFLNVFAPTFAQVRAFTSKPVLVSETAVGQVAGKARKIPDLFAGIRRFGLLGLIWFDVPQNDGLYHQDWHLEGNPPALAAFGRAARSFR